MTTMTQFALGDIDLMKLHQGPDTCLGSTVEPYARLSLLVRRPMAVGELSSTRDQNFFRYLDIACREL